MKVFYSLKEKLNNTTTYGSTSKRFNKISTKARVKLLDTLGKANKFLFFKNNFKNDSNVTFDWEGGISIQDVK